MKKIISLFLAVLMIFSVTTVAFAANEPVENPPTTEAAESGELNIDDIPVWVLKLGPKFAKIVIKIVAVIVKVGMALGLISSDDIIGQLEDFFNGNTNPADPTAPAAEVAIA